LFFSGRIHMDVLEPAFICGCPVVLFDEIELEKMVTTDYSKARLDTESVRPDRLLDLAHAGLTCWHSQSISSPRYSDGTMEKQQFICNFPFRSRPYGYIINSWYTKDQLIELYVHKSQV
jgi:hypothetical protein